MKKREITSHMCGFNNKKHIVSNCKVGKEVRDDVACQPIPIITLKLRFFGKFPQLAGVNDSPDRRHGLCRRNECAVQSA